VLYLHQVHELAPQKEPLFEKFVRDTWLPAVNSHIGARFAWYGTSTHAARFADEAITIVAFDHTAAFARFADAERASDATRALAAHRVDVQTRLLQPVDYDPWTAAGRAIPSVRVDGPVTIYMHDFVHPVIGQMRAYVDLMREQYMAMTDKGLLGLVPRASWRTVGGGGPIPEMFNLSQIRDVDALVALLAHEIPRENKTNRSWMWNALATRDQWTTRLVRSAAWSPVK
jgi:hypothetical protein